MLAVTYARNSTAKERSINSQADDNRAVCAENGWEIVADLSDGTSASRYARRARENWSELLRQLPEVDVVVLWEPSRGDRTLASWVAFIDECRERGVLIHATGHRRTYDPANPRDYRSLAEDGVDSAYETDKQSLRLLRGFAAQAANGRPHAHVTYGYERIYDVRTGALIEQRPHPQHADIVREIVRRVGTGHAISAIAKDLTARGVSSPADIDEITPWRTQTVSAIARSRAYVGIRVHRSKAGQVTEYPAAWPALVTEAEHYAAVRVLSDPTRRTSGFRNGRASTLLGCIAVCGSCGAVATRKRINGTLYYQHCPSVPADAVDELVAEAVIARLSNPDVYDRLAQSETADDRGALDAQGEVDRLSTELEQWRESAVRSETTPASLSVIEAGLTTRIAEARRRAVQSSTHPALRAILSPTDDVRARWEAAPLAAKRDIVRALLTVTIYSSAGRGRTLADRVELTWR